MDSSASKPHLREQARAVMRSHHYSIRTEKSYCTGFATLTTFTSCAIRWSWALQRSMP